MGKNTLGRNKCGRHLNPNPSRARVFFSSRNCDAGQVGFLKSQRRTTKSLDFIDYGIKNPYLLGWKNSAKYRIRNSDAVVVGIGKTTYKSKSVNWEVKTAKKFNKPIIGVKLSKGVKVPDTIRKNGKIINWECNTIQREIDKSKNKRT
ncbi:hypothetical protein Mpt1_c10060 [Candidatus Methanoplasma termitum]|uniref:Thoeris protein ThsB TIR-like domain-containing protein n=1 Tax=Candidatus Methanoplasma termitum TaxID=1577791 RepID=A0A0A7LCT1_9ARCH|nr:TIR domain-containing protein [Candidatus Methanoplasma termitum]AIZ56879.1 hypothetical protein Mpt1_c10060 [Candidatus Methanoplasma termitum]